jgi:hypothetical protein
MGPMSLSVALHKALRLAKDKHPNLLGPFLKYEENSSVVNIALVLPSQHFIVIITYE